MIYINISIVYIYIYLFIYTNKDIFHLYSLMKKIEFCFCKIALVIQWESLVFLFGLKWISKYQWLCSSPLLPRMSLIRMLCVPVHHQCVSVKDCESVSRGLVGNDQVWKACQMVNQTLMSYGYWMTFMRQGLRNSTTTSLVVANHPLVLVTHGIS